MDKATQSKIVSIILTAVIALAAIFGYDFMVIQPRATAPIADSHGTTNLSALETDTITEAGTPVARLSGSTINDTSLSVNSTPVALQVGALAASQRIVCGSTTITGTGTLPHGLATPSYVVLSAAQDTTGDSASLSFTNTAAIVDAKAWTTALTPTAATTPITVNWCIVGKP